MRGNSGEQTNLLHHTSLRSRWLEKWCNWLLLATIKWWMRFTVWLIHECWQLEEKVRLEGEGVGSRKKKELEVGRRRYRKSKQRCLLILSDMVYTCASARLDDAQFDIPRCLLESTNSILVSCGQRAQSALFQLTSNPSTSRILVALLQSTTSCAGDYMYHFQWV